MVETTEVFKEKQRLLRQLILARRKVTLDNTHLLKKFDHIRKLLKSGADAFDCANALIDELEKELKGG